jgi:hypothetical protein
MYPWLWFWAPQIHYPFGTYYQDIEPKTNWFSDTINPEAGDADMEKKIVDKASYGRQLGLITEVLLSMQDGHLVRKEKAKESLDKLKILYTDIEDVKQNSAVEKADTIIDLMKKLQKSDTEQFQRVLRSFTAKPKA